MNKEAANAMLKTLEEPPPNTLIILITNRAHAVLPTIMSRCQILRFAFLSPEQIRTALAARYKIDVSDSKLDWVVDTGSLGNSIYLYENPSDEIRQRAAAFWDVCVSNDWARIAENIDTLSKIDDVSFLERMFIELLQMVRSSFFGRISGSGNYFKARPMHIDSALVSHPERVDALVRICEEGISAINARGMIGLILANTAVSITEIFHGKK